MNLRRLAEAFDEAVAAMELAWAHVRKDHRNRRLLARYVRAMRRCDRLRSELSTLMATGNL